jgi:ABC-type uncharacterized transport system ATPase subunit
MASIRTVGLTKHFGDLRVVNEIDLDLPDAEVAGFVGQNGARKSTAIHMLLCLIRQSSRDGDRATSADLEQAFFAMTSDNSTGTS